MAGQQPFYDPNFPQLPLYLTGHRSDYGLKLDYENSLRGEKKTPNIPVHRIFLELHPAFPALCVPQVVAPSAAETNGKKVSIAPTPTKKKSAEKPQVSTSSQDFVLKVKYLETAEALLWSVYTNQEEEKLPLIHKKLTTAQLLDVVEDIHLYWHNVVIKDPRYNDKNALFDQLIAQPYWNKALSDIDWEDSSNETVMIVKHAIRICSAYNDKFNLNGDDYNMIAWDLLVSLNTDDMVAWARTTTIPELCVAWCCEMSRYREEGYEGSASVEDCKKVLEAMIYYEPDADKNKDPRLKDTKEQLDKDVLDLCYARSKPDFVVAFVATHCDINSEDLGKLPKVKEGIFIYREAEIITGDEPDSRDNSDDEAEDEEEVEEDEEGDSDEEDDEEEVEENKEESLKPSRAGPKPKPNTSTTIAKDKEAVDEEEEKVEPIILRRGGKKH